MRARAKQRWTTAKHEEGVSVKKVCLTASHALRRSLRRFPWMMMHWSVTQGKTATDFQDAFKCEFFHENRTLPSA
jgi:hypothetical protein